MAEDITGRSRGHRSHLASLLGLKQIIIWTNTITKTGDQLFICWLHWIKCPSVLNCIERPQCPHVFKVRTGTWSVCIDVLNTMIPRHVFSLRLVTAVAFFLPVKSRILTNERRHIYQIICGRGVCSFYVRLNSKTVSHELTDSHNRS